MSVDEWLLFRDRLRTKAEADRKRAMRAAGLMVRRGVRVFLHLLNRGRDAVTRGYWIVRVSVNDAARYPEYLEAARPAFERFGARFLVRGGPFEAMEGNARARNVIVEFRDYETAMACYRSPEYQAAKAIRNSIADADFIIVEGASATP